MSDKHLELVGGLCFVYGSLREGLGNHRVLGESKRQDDGVIPFGFRMRSMGGFPAIYHAGAQDETPITVEVYEVSSEDVAQRLDWLEGYPNFYDRKVIKLADGRVGWVYFIHREDTSRPLVPEGDWKKFLGK